MCIRDSLGIALIPKYLKQGDALKICAILGVIFSIGALIAPADKVFTMPFIDLMTFEPLHLVPVSYTHLDVYKRQAVASPLYLFPS